MKSVTLAAAIALVLTATSCSTLSPASFGAKSTDIRTKWSGPVAVTGIHKSDPASRFNANGMECTSNHFDAWAYDRGIAVHFITPGRPTENAVIESFNGKLRTPQEI